MDNTPETPPLTTHAFTICTVHTCGIFGLPLLVPFLFTPACQNACVSNSGTFDTFSIASLLLSGVWFLAATLFALSQRSQRRTTFPYMAGMGIIIALILVMGLVHVVLLNTGHDINGSASASLVCGVYVLALLVSIVLRRRLPTIWLGHGMLTATLLAPLVFIGWFAAAFLRTWFF